MITNKSEAKTMAKHISCNCRCKFNSAACNSNQKWNNKTCQCEWKYYLTCKIDYSWNHSTCFCENDKCLKSISDTSVIAWDEIISVMDIVSNKMTITIATNVTKNCHGKKARYKFDCCILHTVLLAIILLPIITIICYHYVKHTSKPKGINALAI